MESSSSTARSSRCRTVRCTVPGPVVLLRVPTAQDGSPFRGGGATIERDAILAGTLADLIGTLESEVEASLACSVTASLFSAAPLVAAAIEGLLP